MNDIQPGPRSSQSAAGTSAILAMVHGLLWISFAAFLMFFVPRYERTFRDFDMTVPGTTIFVLETSRLVVKCFYVLVPCFILLFATDWAILFVLRRNPGTKIFSWLWFVLLSLLPIAALSCSWAAVWLPYVKVLEGLSR